MEHSDFDFLRVQQLAAAVLGISGSWSRHRGNSIIVWIDSLDPLLFTQSIWSKPIECLSERIPMAAIRGCSLFISMHFKRISNSFTFNSLPFEGPAVMWSSPLVPASSVEYNHRTRDELTRQVPYSSEWQFAFWKSASGSIVFPEIELAHQQTLNSSLWSPPLTPPLPPSLPVRSF